MSRPRKRKLEPRARRVTDEGKVDDLSVPLGQLHINTLRADPVGDHPLAVVLGSVILDRGLPSCEELAGKMFVAVLKHPDPAVATRFFRSIMAMKANVSQPHRNAYAFHAYARFIEETGREPSKPELRAYIEARRNEFKDAPSAGDKAGWARVWKAAGLSDLAPK
jgi:hypothetical protein